MAPPINGSSSQKEGQEDDNDGLDESLIDPKLLAGLTSEERKEALQAAAIAKRAEERAEERALERARQQREKERKQQQQKETAILTSTPAAAAAVEGQKKIIVTKEKIVGNDDGVVFVSKRKRKAATTAEVTAATETASSNSKGDVKPSSKTNNQQSYHGNGDSRSGGGRSFQNDNHPSSSSSSRGGNHRQQHNPHQNQQQQYGRGGGSSSANSQSSLMSSWTERDLEAVKESYLGKSAAEAEVEKAEKRKKQRTNKKITFRFKWDDTDDTFNEQDPLYSSAVPVRGPNSKNRNNPRDGYIIKGRGSGRMENSSSLSSNRNRSNFHRDLLSNNPSSFNIVDSTHTKPLAKMTSRDWRIFRENYEIVVRGGKAPPPLRTFRESPSPDVPDLHPSILDALENVMGFKEPTPIQRQAIPIGLRRRDLIGIAETGSGKTVAFGVPLCNYILNLPQYVVDRVADEGPLALVMAPTRELALQINDEFTKLLKRQKNILNCCIVGGQAIQQQAYAVRQGVHIVVGTPGRINECIEMAYLVLNQCYYVVLDEADRMIDMGFAPQIESVMETMGGLLKSENENETYQQEIDDLKSGTIPRHRVTAMFSATMPLEVERIAKRYLRHPAVVSIGDQDSSKNARIEQRIIFLSSPSQKENALREILHKTSYRSRDDKIIVFVNEKKHADGLGRAIERMGRTCVVLHGGKSQEQREESLATFRNGGVVMVATDVAGRGLDIPDVSHVINYDLPSRSIENYSHRIGRTGRAGKLGLATSFITEADEAIMAPLKAYLESTGSHVPPRLANHPAAASSNPSSLIH